jgi:dienelactone hydrolase
MSFDFASLDDPIIPAAEADELRRRLYQAADGWLTEQVGACETSRKARWHRDYSSTDAYRASVEPNRRRFMQMIGAWDAEREDWPWDRTPLGPRVEYLFETPHYRCDRLYLTPMPGLVVDGLLLTPPGDEPRPAILCQHGLGGGPEVACGFCADRQAAGYNSFGLRMAREGWVVFAPRMMGGYGRGEYQEVYVPPHDPARAAVLMARTRLYRKAMQLGYNLFGLEMFVLSRFVDYVQTLPTVIADRIGLYGLSQGGQTAVFYPACDQRIRASVCSAYFNWRMVKQLFSDPEGRWTAYIDTNEEEKLFLGHLREFSDSDIASLIAPRAFMVECGKLDGAVHWEHSVREFQALKRHYELLGIPERAQHCLHEGGHECRCIESFEFLRTWV